VSHASLTIDIEPRGWISASLEEETHGTPFTDQRIRPGLRSSKLEIK
jgi:hypothetical protein